MGRDKMSNKSTRLFTIFSSLCELSRDDIHIFSQHPHSRSAAWLHKEFRRSPECRGSFYPFAISGPPVSEEISYSPLLAPSLTLSVENTQPVGSLLSASPNSWTGILLSERSLLRIPSLERFGG